VRSISEDVDHVVRCPLFGAKRPHWRDARSTSSARNGTYGDTSNPTLVPVPLSRDARDVELGQPLSGGGL
jgi:hypothetical protein